MVHMRIVIREIFETGILAVLIFLALHLSVQNYRVEGPSMRPTLDEGEYVIVNKLLYLRLEPHELARLVPYLDVEDNRSLFPFHEPSHGEVVIFRFPKDESRDFIKRVIGVPGDTIEIKSGQVIRNGVVVDEPYVTLRDGTSMAPVVVPPDAYFVLGDNRRASNDSRDWGAVPAENIIGRAWLGFWPLDRWHVLRARFWP